MNRLVLRTLAIAAVALLVLTAWAWIRGSVSVQFDAQASQRGRLQVFHDADGAFSERATHWLDIATDAPALRTLRIPADGARALRIDPPADAETTLCELRVDGAPATYSLASPLALAATRRGTCLVLRADPGAADPQVVLRLEGESAQRLARAATWHALAAPALGLSMLLVVGTAWYSRARWRPRLAAMQAPAAWRWLDTRLHYVAMLAVLLFGTAFAFSTPPGAVPDEQAHLAKVVRVAWGAPFGGRRDMALPDFDAAMSPFVDLMNNKRPFSAAELRDQQMRPLGCIPAVSTGLHGADGYSPHQYLLPAIAFRATCAGGWTFGSFFYSARLLNVLLAAVLVGWGVSAAGRGRLALVLVALLPMSLFQTASLSADAVVIAASIAWLGLVSGVASGTRALRRVDPGLLLLAIGVALLKPGSAWILVAFLFCRARYRSEGLAFWPAAAMYMVAPMALHAAFTLAMGGSAPRLDGADPTANLALLLADPLHVLQVLTWSFIDSATWLVHSLIGLLGWLDVGLAAWAYSLAMALALASVFTNARDGAPSPAWIRPAAVVVAAGALVLLVLPLFIYWTHTGALRITAFQGRYFLPVAAFLLAWVSVATPPVVRGWLSLAVLAGIAAIDVHALARLHEAYFITGR